MQEKLMKKPKVKLVGYRCVCGYSCRVESWNKFSLHDCKKKLEAIRKNKSWFTNIYEDDK